MKKGSYYEVKQYNINTFVRNDSAFEPFGVVHITLDSESKHLESSVSHILDIIGYIGGSFELVHYIIFMVYSYFSKSLYYYTIINGISDFQRSQNKVDIKSHRTQPKMSRQNRQQTEIQRRPRRYDESDEHDESKHAEIAPNNQTKKRDYLVDRVFGIYLKKEENYTQLVRK